MTDHPEEALADRRLGRAKRRPNTDRNAWVLVLGHRWRSTQPTVHCPAFTPCGSFPISAST